MRPVISKNIYTLISSLLILALIFVLFLSFRFLYQATQRAFQMDIKLIEARTLKFDMEGYEEILPKIRPSIGGGDEN